MANGYERQNTYTTVENTGADIIRVTLSEDGQVSIHIGTNDANVTRTLSENDTILLRKQLDAFVPDYLKHDGIEIQNEVDLVRALHTCSKDAAWNLINDWFSFKRLEPNAETDDWK